MSALPTEPIDKQSVLRNFCSGITVIAAGTEASGLVGFTCQSFSFVSHTPLLISFCPALTSVTWPRIRDGRRFTVNVLSRKQREISDAFARSGGEKFAGIPWRQGAAGPILEASLGWLACELHAEYDAGDHTIVVADVADLHFDVALEPLLYFRSRYHLARPEDALPPQPGHREATKPLPPSVIR